MKTYTIKISVDMQEVDEAIEKAKLLKSLLLEVRRLLEGISPH